MADERIVYGATCVWWDSVEKVGTVLVRGGHQLPCCPECRGPLMELPTIEEWDASMDRYETDGHPGYRAMMEWSRGKCFPGMAALRAAYERSRTAS